MDHLHSTLGDLDPYDRNISDPTPEHILACMNESREFVHLHSVIYEALGKGIVPDWRWDTHSERIRVQNAEHPEIAAQAYRPDLFGDWTGATGMGLPADPDILGKAWAAIGESGEDD